MVLRRASEGGKRSCSPSELTDLSHALWHVMGKQISRGFQGGVAPWSQGGGLGPARDGEAGSLDGIEASVGRGKAKLFPLRVGCLRRIDHGK
jgi:hypothetical protein